MIESIGTPLYWGAFFAFVAVILAVDLLVVNRKAHVIKPKEAFLWTAVCVSLALAFAGWLGWQFGARPALEFTTGYLIEYALSVDNLFVFLVIFKYFAVPEQFQHRVLFWGILIAMLLRGVFIVAGTALLARFHWAIFFFGAFLAYTGVKLLFAGDAEVEPEKNPIVRLARRILPLTSTYHGEHFFVVEAGRRVATPLFLVFLVVNVTDVVFAVDSIPAIFGVTTDPFLVFTSNIFAVLGLRSLYFLLADLMGKFHYLKYGLGLVLAFVGVKMLVADWVHVPIGLSLGVIVSTLAGAIAASWLRARTRPTA